MVASGDRRIEVVRDIRAVPPEVWNDFLAADDIQASHSFVAACQESGVESAEYWFLLIRDGDRTVCIAALSAFRVNLELLAPRGTRSMVTLMRHLRRGFLSIPVLFCGLPVSFGRSCLRFRPGVRDAADFVAEVAAVMEHVARERRISLLCFKEFDDVERAAVDAVRHHGYLAAPSLPFCTMSLPWKSFDEYLEAMRADYRRQVLHTLAARESSRLKVRRISDVGPHVPRLFDLYQRIMDRAEHQLERLNLRFFEALVGGSAENCHAVVIERSDTILAFALMLCAGEVTTFLLTGFDDRECRDAQLYPNLVLAVIEDALARGATRLHMGQTSYALKTRLGAVVEPRMLYLRFRGAWRHRLLQSAAPLLFPRTTVPLRRVFHKE